MNAMREYLGRFGTFRSFGILGKAHGDTARRNRLSACSDRSKTIRRQASMSMIRSWEAEQRSSPQSDLAENASAVS